MGRESNCGIRESVSVGCGRLNHFVVRRLCRTGTPASKIRNTLHQFARTGRQNHPSISVPRPLSFIRT
jgi:hypothetical protein